MRCFIVPAIILATWIGYSEAQAQELCDIECLRQRVVKLEQAVKELTEQTNGSIKSGQSVTLKMTQGDHPGGCLPLEIRRLGGLMSTFRGQGRS